MPGCLQVGKGKAGKREGHWAFQLSRLRDKEAESSTEEMHMKLGRVLSIIGKASGTCVRQSVGLNCRGGVLPHRSEAKRRDAYDLLAPVYNWFTEGFDTADLQEAKALGAYEQICAAVHNRSIALLLKPRSRQCCLIT